MKRVGRAAFQVAVMVGVAWALWDGIANDAAWKANVARFYAWMMLFGSAMLIAANVGDEDMRKLARARGRALPAAVHGPVWLMIAFGYAAGGWFFSAVAMALSVLCYEVAWGVALRDEADGSEW